MSVSNPFSPTYGWRVDLDNRQDRSNGPCQTREMTQEEKIKYGIAVERNDNMLKMTKKEVLEMSAAGKTLEEIVEHFTQGNDKNRSMYIAKATLFLNGPKEKKKKESDDYKTVVIELPAPDDYETREIEAEAPVMSTLRTRLVEDIDSGLMFELGDTKLFVEQRDNGKINILWEKLDAYIENLQKLKQIHESA